MTNRTRFDAYMSQQLADRDIVEVIHKFGRSASLTTSFTPIAIDSIYRTPQVSGATKLRVKAGNTNDTADGSGARELTLEGLDETGAKVTETIATAGTSASATTQTTFLRLFRAYVSASGTYASASAGSHAAKITIEDAAGSEDWASIYFTDFPRSQTEIGSYTVPLGFDAYVYNVEMFVDSNKRADIIFFQRQNILETAAPYTAMRVISDFHGVEGEESLKPVFPFGPYPALTDIGFMAKASATADVEVDFEIALVKSAT